MTINVELSSYTTSNTIIRPLFPKIDKKRKLGNSLLIEFYSASSSSAALYIGINVHDKCRRAVSHETGGCSYICSISPLGGL